MFVFFDAETTGTSTAFDQILQFAAVLADEDLREVDRFEVRCRLMPHIVPSPGALWITGLRPGDLLDPALPSHAEAIGRIAERLGHWSPAIFLGWNSLRFDESLLRQALFQTLRPPFLTTSRGNGRGDVFRMVQAAERYAPGTLVVPLDHRGMPSFRLDRLAPANGCAGGPAHDAMADTRATLGLARLLHARVPGLWRMMVGLTRPDAVRSALRDAEAMLHTDFVFNRAHHRLVTYCGTNPHYDGEIAAFDLAFRPEDVMDLPVDRLVAELARRPRTILSIRATRQPLLLPAAMAPPDTGALRFPPAVLTERAGRIGAAGDFHRRVGLALARRPRPSDGDRPVESRIYDRRIPGADLERMEAFHAAPWNERPAVAERFDDGRLRELGHRLVWIERPDVLADGVRTTWDRWAADRVLSEDPDAPWRTAQAALREAENAIANADAEQRPRFEEIRDFLESIADRWARLI